MGANAISRPRTQRDPVRMFSPGQGLPVRLSPTVADTAKPAWNFPDTEKITVGLPGPGVLHTGATSPTWQVRSARVQSGQLGAGVGVGWGLEPALTRARSTTLTIRLAAGATKSTAKPPATSHVKTAT